MRKDGTFTGEQRDVTDTLHDFRKPRRLGDVIQELSKHQPEWPHGDAYMTGNNHKLADYESFETQFVGGVHGLQQRKMWIMGKLTQNPFFFLSWWPRFLCRALPPTQWPLHLLCHFRTGCPDLLFHFSRWNTGQSKIKMRTTRGSSLHSACSHLSFFFSPARFKYYVQRGVTYEKYGGVCLEFQRFADCYAMKEKDGNKAAYNRRFRSCSSLAPGQYYIQRTAWHLHTK